MFKCLICSKSLPSKRGLANHIRTHGITPSEYKRKFEYELNKEYVEGKDYLTCPLCGKKVQFLHSHLKRTHHLTNDDISKMDINKYSTNSESIVSERTRKSWSNMNEDAYRARCSRISETKSKLWTKEDTERLYQARLDSGCYKLIGKKAHETIVSKYDSYEDYLNDVTSRLPSGHRGTRILSEDSYGPVTYRSTYEYKVSRLLNQLNLVYKYEPFWLPYFNTKKGKTSHYCPDFFIESLNLVIEVKPTRFIDDIVLAKKEAVIQKGYNFVFATESDLTLEQFKLLVMI